MRWGITFAQKSSFRSTILRQGSRLKPKLVQAAVIITWASISRRRNPRFTPALWGRQSFLTLARGALISIEETRSITMPRGRIFNNLEDYFRDNAFAVVVGHRLAYEIQISNGMVGWKILG
ncbi:hypothetical protein F4861DRAFT_537552 [Xylaria intraflava]|nr:hypothetical protein F4861DRAFT_537552 [Xylaria intraflava]